MSESSVIVADVGSFSARMGFSSTIYPKSWFPSSVGLLKDTKKTVIFDEVFPQTNIILFQQIKDMTQNQESC